MESEKNQEYVSDVQSVDAGVAEAQPSRLPYLQERVQFRALILANPNYFGNIKVSPFTPVLQIQSNTVYEELCSVGFQPQFNRLEAVVFVKQPSGYGGDICSNGTPEYVRFYVSYDNGASWDDEGVASFTAYNIPAGTTGARRLEYAVTAQINPPKKPCSVRNIVLVRAILSWNVPPPPDTPDFVPVWGNVHNTHIQIDPRRFFVLGELLDHIQLSPELLKTLDLTQPLAEVETTPLAASELQVLYKDKGIEPHRFALPELHQLMNQPALSASLMAPGGGGGLQGLDIDLSNIIGKLFPTDGDTRYEELVCVGLNPNQDTLAGVIKVKLPNGYSGDLCTAGSREFVTFWADFNNNGTFETCLGTTSVRVHDIADIPAEGLEYAVFLPVNLAPYRQPCEKGPKVVRIRAILSWQVAPPCWNPNYVPVWGNREETLIHIKPGPSIQPGTHAPFIETVGSMAVEDIHPVTGLASGLSALAGFTAHNSPFGGEVVITGHIAYPTDISNGAAALEYRVFVRKLGEPWQRLTNTFSVARSQLLDGVWSSLPSVTQAVDADDFYPYREDLTSGPGNPQIFVVGNVLARWQTGGLSGVWQIVIEAKNPAVVGPSWFSNSVTVRLDNTAPVPSIAITSGGGNCADFTIGDIISGTYAAFDEHFGSLTLSVLPAQGGSFTTPPPLPAAPSPHMPLSRSYPLVPTGGEAGTWSLDTTGMPRCGYVLEIGVTDRTIVNSGAIGFYNRALVGLCLRAPEE